MTDYCFARDSSSSDPLTVLVGRLYPSRALFATVCEHKSAHDQHTVNRLCLFLKNAGVTQMVYRTDQENAVVTVIREAIKVSQTPGHPLQGMLTSAIPENSAVGQSPSNSRAEKAVQQIEDISRTYMSAIASRVKCKIPSSHPICR